MKLKLLLVLVATLFVLLGCRQADPELTQKIETAEAAWAEAGITTYDLSIRRQKSLGAMQILQMSVVDGEIRDVEQDCLPSPAQAGCSTQEVDPADYTVPGLFELAHKNNYRASIVSFDDDIGVMTFMSWTDESTFRVEFTAGE